MYKKYATVFLLTVLALVVLIPAAGVPVIAQGGDEQTAINLAATSGEFADWLAGYNHWQGSAYPDDTEPGLWYVDFYDETVDEWLGWAAVDLNTGEIVDSFVPRPLPPEEFQAGQERVTAFVLNDPEVLALLEDPDLWELGVDFNRYDQQWEAWFARGLDALVVTLYQDGDNFYIDEIEDANALSEQQALQAARDQAITLAYEAEGVWEALDGVDDWYTYTERQGDNLWSVEFTTADGELFYALVDVAAEKVLETAIGGR